MDCEKLVKQLREWHENLISELCLDDKLDCDDLCDCRHRDCIVLQAAAAIETLLTEQKAAMEELRLGECDNCKHENVDVSKPPCRNCVVCGGMSDNWEWHG